ncbi:hypothetical protein PV328_006891 [Microctonus aethiopoides]|uniref:DNA primase large subunit C-terminal domain-containing protein n=1 Tax=Microctonus aethiopoides TaxID=144406 RepID=A0AA39KU14_9HYME|nr:hypothetical protein PV328_006891 [Microctonus aethiopoides]
MAFDQTASFCGLDVTVRINDSSDETATIKYTRKSNPPLQQIYPLDIQFYTRIPCPILVEKMKALVKERVLALKEIHLVMKNPDHATLNDKRKFVTAKLGIMRLHRYAKFINSKGHQTYSIEELEDRIADHASFVALRLAVAPNKEEKDTHRRIEEQLFHMRVSALDNEGIRQLLAFNKIEYEKISNIERIELKDMLIELLHNPDEYDSTDFFKIPILTLLGFIKVNDVYLQDGIAFVPLEQMRGALRAHYHNHLVYEAAAINTNNLEAAYRFADGYGKFNEFFHFCCEEFQIMQQKIMKESNISIRMIDMLAQTAFPPCMRMIHDYLRERHHLKHESRLQYTLFLKGIGLKVKDTLSLFRDEFIKTVSLERFEKEYTYYIYHAYGMRGRRYDTPPKDCHQIIHGTIPFGDCNGCMFANSGVSDIEELGRKMTRWNISAEHIDEMIDYTKSGECGYACAKYFHAINKYAMTEPITHPNKFFIESRRLSNLPTGCVSDESEDSDNEICDDNSYPEIPSDVDNKLLSVDSFHDTHFEFVEMLICWELQKSIKNLRPGSMVKLKRKR